MPMLTMMLMVIGLGAVHMEIAGFPNEGDKETQQAFYHTVVKLEHGRGVQSSSSSDVSAVPKDARTLDAAANEVAWMDVAVGVDEIPILKWGGPSQHPESSAAHGVANRPAATESEEAAEQSTNMEIQPGRWWHNTAFIIPAFTSVIVLIAGVVYSIHSLRLRTFGSIHAGNSSPSPLRMQCPPRAARKSRAGAARTPGGLSTGQPLSTFIEGFIARAKYDGGSDPDMMDSGTPKDQALQQGAAASPLAALSSVVTQLAQTTPSASLLPSDRISAHPGHGNAIPQYYCCCATYVRFNIEFQHKLACRGWPATHDCTRDSSGA
jgi:hypothetical protein